MKEYSLENAEQEERLPSLEEKKLASLEEKKKAIKAEMKSADSEIKKARLGRELGKIKSEIKHIKNPYAEKTYTEIQNYAERENYRYRLFIKTMEKCDYKKTEKCVYRKVVILCKKLSKNCSFESEKDAGNLCALIYWLYILGKEELAKKCIELTHNIPLSNLLYPMSILHGNIIDVITVTKKYIDNKNISLNELIADTIYNEDKKPYFINENETLVKMTVLEIISEWYKTRTEAKQQSLSQEIEKSKKKIRSTINNMKLKDLVQERQKKIAIKIEKLENKIKTLEKGMDNIENLIIDELDSLEVYTGTNIN
ncbi:MAG: hypothetical protein LBK66_13825 [Spirochaetaceae bacterium]|nr:hypothetical protein [Spirochaetaceae bacterium]